MKIQMPSAISATGESASKAQAKTRKTSFQSVLGDRQVNQPKAQSSKMDRGQNVRSDELMSLEKNVRERQDFLNDAASTLGISAFNILPVTGNPILETGLPSLLAIQSESEAQTLLRGMLSPGSFTSEIDRQISALIPHEASVLQEVDGIDTDIEGLDQGFRLKQAIQQLKNGQAIAHLKGTAESLKANLMELSQRWAAELNEGDPKQSFSKEFVPLSLDIEHSPSEQLQAAVDAVVTQTQSVSGVDLADGAQGLAMLSGPASVSSASLTNSEPSMAVQLAMASHMELELPQFTPQLKRLSLKIQDPAGVMMVEIVKEAQELHVRAIIPPEAMSDMNNIEADIRHQLSQQGLDLGSFEMYSQNEQGKKGAQSDVPTSDGSETHAEEARLSNNILDRRI